MRRYSKRIGFTLVELLIVIGLIGILAAIVVVAINPTRQLGSARDANRETHLNSLLNAIGQYTIDFRGILPCAPGGTPCVDSTWRMLGMATSGCNQDALCGVLGLPTVCLDITTSLSPNYVSTIPTDPRYGDLSSEAGSKTWYVVKFEDNRIFVRACQPEIAAAIEYHR